MMRLLAIAAILMLPACIPEERPTGAEDFANYCASCHGVSGRGDGPLAAELAVRPADLTRLARRNGGSFPTTKVMAKIWGYTGGQQGTAVMPNFGPLLESALMPYDGGDGIMTPTPERLVQIAEHIRRLQQ